MFDVAVDSNKGAHLKFVLGDFFRFSKKVAGSFEAVFDRGSLVAIEPELRQHYAATVDSVLTPGGRILLVAVEVHPN